MRDALIDTNVAAIALVLVGCLKLLQRTGRWKRRFGMFGSSLIKMPAHRVLFVLILIGVLLITALPEAAFVLPALDAVGLDIVTIFAVFELRNYWASLARLVGIPTSGIVYVRSTVAIVSRQFNFLRMYPVLLLYACVWPVIWIRTHVH